VHGLVQLLVKPSVRPSVLLSVLRLVLWSELLSVPTWVL